MWETRPVEVVLDLPVDLVDRVEEVRQRDPEFLSRVIRYGLARRTMYNELERSLESGAGAARI